MLRRILGYILLVALLSGTAWLGYRYFLRLSSSEQQAIDAVPPTAALAVQFHDFSALWKTLSGGNLMWNELKSEAFLQELESAGKQLDSLIRHDPVFVRLLAGQPIVFSIHPQGDKATEWLFTATGKAWEDAAVPDQVAKAFGQNGSQVLRRVKTDVIYRIAVKNKEYFLVLKNGTASLASSATLAEAVIGHLESGKSIRETEGFEAVYQTLDPNAAAAVVVIHKVFGAYLSSAFLPEAQEWIGMLKPYALFSELDLSIASGTLSFNGFSAIDSAHLSFLSVFSAHAPQSFTASPILPENTSAFVWIGVQDGESFHAGYERWLERTGRLDAHQQAINAFNLECDCNVREGILSWMGSEMVLFSTASADNPDLNGQQFLAVKINETEEPTRPLQALAAKLSGDTTFNEYTPYRLQAGGIFGLLFGAPLSGINSPYFVRQGDFIVFANSGEALENYLIDIGADRSLGKNITYHNFVSQHLSDRANLMLYINPQRVMPLLRAVLSPAWLKAVEEKSALRERFDAFAWQVAQNGRGLFYNNLYLRFNATGKQDSKALWELVLDTTLSSPAHYVHNHITGTDDIILQDDAYTLYHISNQGEIQWKKPLEEKITGLIRQIDYFGNGKLQLLFCTQSQLHLIDLKGNDLEGFPVDLRTQVTGSPAVFDYENNGTYRIFIPAGRHILNYEKTGQRLTGWEFEGAEAEITESPVFFRIDRKDYIFACDVNGNLYVLDRKGKSRYTVPAKIEDRSINPIRLEPGKNIETTRIIYSTVSGKVCKLYFSGNTDTAAIGILGSDHRFVMAEAYSESPQEEIIVLDSGLVRICTWDGKTVGEYRPAEAPVGELMVFPLRDGTVRIGLRIPATGEIVVLQNRAALHPRFPLMGRTAFSLADINRDGLYEVVTGSGGRRIFCYSFN